MSHGSRARDGQIVRLVADLEVSKEKKFGPVQQPLGVVSGRVGETWQETMATTREKKRGNCVFTPVLNSNCDFTPTFFDFAFFTLTVHK